MSFVKSLLIILLMTAFARVGHTEGIMFTVNSSELGAGAESADGSDTQALIGRLKLRAVADWLQNLLGARYDQFASQVTGEFAERYVLDYKVSRRPGGVVELSGHLDADSLKRWARTSEAKAGGSSAIKPLFILSSDLVSLGFSPRDTNARVGDNHFAQVVYNNLNSHLGKFNTHLTPLSGGNLGLTQPPRTPNEIAALKDAAAPAGYTGVIWVHIASCKSCGGSRMDTFYFNLPMSRIGLVKSDDLNIDVHDFASAERAKKVTKAPLQEFESDFDDLVSSGTLYSASYHLLIEGIDSYRAYKSIDNGMTRLDFLTRATIRRSEAGIAEYEILSSLAADEIFQRFHLASFPGFQLKPVRVDSDTIVVRYSK